MMKRLVSLILAIASVTAVFAQNTAGVSGRVTDAATGAAIDFADVVITDDDNNTVASGTVREGRFAIDRVRAGEHTLSILLVGYQPYSTKIGFAKGETVDLGDIRLAMVETGLQEVTVTGQRSKIVYKLDRQRINASAVLSASGGTAVDILNSTPSVRVDADGEVSAAINTNPSTQKAAFVVGFSLQPWQ